MSATPLGANEHAIAIQADGHARVLPRRAVSRWAELRPEEQQALFALAQAIRPRLGGRRFTVGVDTDSTPPAVLVIPRDTADGGISALLPSKQALTTGPDRSLLRAIRPLIRQADHIEIVAAFVQEGGLKLLQGTLLDALRRGATLRILTGDYLHITQSSALQRLLDWQDQVAAFTAQDSDGNALSGTLQIRVIETAQTQRAFHPKSWRFERTDGSLAVAYVGSSNLSVSALRTGVEWNLRVTRSRQPGAYAEVRAAFAALWDSARPIDAGWVADYAVRAAEVAHALPIGEVESETQDTPRPTQIQQDALLALARSRAEGRGRALVVMATGLGKTFLAAFDVLAWQRDAGRTPRVLFVAHRRELLRQAAATFRRLMPTAPFGWCVGSRAELDGQVVFASIQKLSRPAQLHRLRGDAFDYVIIDEVHHAAATGYRRVLRWLSPGFLLGLTATPERADEADILRLFDDHLPFRADLAEGISRGLLVPFHYTGLADTIDYGPLPWRGRGFDVEALSVAVCAQDRMERMWAAWQDHPGSRTLLFCVSIAHADFVCDWLQRKGVRIEAVHSGENSADRQAAVEALEDGQLDALCTVDLFNEGIDIRPVDRVIMLRPTESSVVFLQQLGRGLRTAPGKDSLTVLDFVGNHRVFLTRLRGLIALGDAEHVLAQLLDTGHSTALPGGCALSLTPTALQHLGTFLPQSDTDEFIRIYRSLRTLRDRRPCLGELLRLGLDPTAIRTRHGGWLDFLGNEDDLTGAELRAIGVASPWFTAIETSRMNKSFRLVLLEVLLHFDALLTGMPLAVLAAHCHAAYCRDPILFADLMDTQRLPNPRAPSPEQWMSYWRERALRNWGARTGHAWFVVENGNLVPRLPVQATDTALVQAFTALTAELVDGRLARYRRRQTTTTSPPAFDAAVMDTQQGMHLKRPAHRTANRTLIARLPDGQPWSIRFVDGQTIAHPLLGGNDQLPTLLRRWFGPWAGQPDYRHRVRFTPTADGWFVSPQGGMPPALRQRREVPLTDWAALLHPQLHTYADGAEDDRNVVVLPAPRQPLLLAVRATEDEHDQNDQPICRGDWLLLRPESPPLSRVHQTRAVVTGKDLPPLLCTPVRRSDRFLLRSATQHLPAPSDVRVLATVVSSISPESLAPAEGTRIPQTELARTFGVSTAPQPGHSVVDGHRFCLLESAVDLPAPDRLRAPVPTPCSTAYVLARTDPSEPWSYIGVMRPCAPDNTWSFPAMPYAVWRALAGQRAPQKTLPSDAHRAARDVVRRAVQQQPTLRLQSGQGTRTVTRRTQRRGLRLEQDHLPLLSLTLADIGWAWLHSQADDHWTVNQRRYLNGTPAAQQRRQAMRWACALLDWYHAP